MTARERALLAQILTADDVARAIRADRIRRRSADRLARAQRRTAEAATAATAI